MCVGVDGDFAAMLFGQSQVEIVEVGSGWAGVVFYGYSQLGGTLENFVEVEGVGVALQHLAAGGVAEDSCVRIFERAEDAIGHLVDGLVEAAVDAGDDDVHLGEGGVVEVELAFSENVDLDAGENADAPLHLSVDLADALDVSEGALVVHAVGHGEIFAVVGDGDVFQATGKSGLGHLADGVSTVGFGRVHVQVAVNVGEGDELRKRLGGGGFKFAGVFAQLGWDVVEVKGAIDRFFGGGGNDGVVFEPG